MMIILINSEICEIFSLQNFKKEVLNMKKRSTTMTRAVILRISLIMCLTQMRPSPSSDMRRVMENMMEVK